MTSIAGGQNFYFDSKVLLVTLVLVIVMNIPLGLLYVTLILIPLFPRETLFPKTKRLNQYIKSHNVRNTIKLFV